MRIENWELRIGQIRSRIVAKNTEQSRQALFPRMRIENWELRIGQIRFPDYRENTEQSRQALFPRMRIENWDAERKRDSAQPQ
jgi:hypothetical protein